MPRIYPIDAETARISEVGSFWEGFEFGHPTKYHQFMADFHSIVLASWTTTEVGAGTQAITDAAGGVLLLTNAAADNDAITMQLGATGDGAAGESFLPASGKTLWFESRFHISDATQSDALVGLVVTDTTPLANANGIYFRKDDGDALLDFETNASSVASTDAGIITVVANTYLKAGFKVTGTELVEYWINDQRIGSFTGNIPLTEMRPTIHIQNGEAAAKTMSIDYIFCAQTR